MMAGEVGQIVSGISLLFGAGVALWTAINVTRRQGAAQQKEWNELRRSAASDTLRALHHQFWQDEDVVKIRRCVVNDVEYNEYLKPVLARRNALPRGTPNTLSREDNDVLEEVDRYCGTMLRIKSFIQDYALTPTESELWRTLLWSHWREKIKSDRAELRDYIAAHWDKELLTEPEAAKPSR